jgi:hypothetical protein
MSAMVDRCAFTALASGTGAFGVASATPGYMTPSSAGAVSGSSYSYAAETVDGSGNITGWEVGKGTWDSTALSRSTVYFSSTGGTAVNFGSAPTVKITVLAEGLLAPDIPSQTISGGANVSSLALSTGSFTADPGLRPQQYITNAGAFTISAPASDGNCLIFVTNSTAAGTITFSSFSVGTNVGDTLTTSSGSKFTLSIWRINGVSGYRVAAHQ